MVEPQLPQVATKLPDVKEEITAFADFPEAHWRKIWFTKLLERLNREVKRGTDVVGIFPNSAALLRPAAYVLIEANDESQVADRHYFSEPPWPNSTRQHRPSWESSRAPPRR